MTLALLQDGGFEIVGMDPSGTRSFTRHVALVKMNIAFIDKRVGVENVALPQHPGILVSEEIFLHEVLESGACFLMF